MQFLSRFRLTLLRSLLELLCVSNLHRAGLTCQSVDICLEFLCPPQVENRLIKKIAQEQLCGPVHLGLTLWLHWKALARQWSPPCCCGPLVSLPPHEAQRGASCGG